MHHAFKHNALNLDGCKKVILAAKALDEALREIQKVCPVGRELSLVITKLEEANYFARRSIESDLANIAEVTNHNPEEE